MSDHISLEEVTQLASLANLTLSPNEADKIRVQLSSVVDHFQSLQNIDLTNVPITSQVTGLENITRQDATGERTLDNQSAISQSPSTHNGYVKVKAILNQPDNS